MRRPHAPHSAVANTPTTHALNYARAHYTRTQLHTLTTRTTTAPTHQPRTWLLSCSIDFGTRRATSHIAQFQMNGSVPKRAETPGTPRHCLAE